MKTNPWIARYHLADDDLDGFGRIERRASNLALTGASPDVDVETLKSNMREIFLCSSQIRRVIRQLLALGQSHAQTHFPSAQAWVAGLYSSAPWGTEVSPAVMLTGLAGVGKTQLVQALQRLLGNPVTTILPGHQQVPVVPAWFMTLRNGSGLNRLVRPWLDAATHTVVEHVETNSHQKERKDLNLSKLLELARRVSRRDGVCLAVVDELQFITHSAQANALATSVLLQLLGIGPRLVFVSNYSLAHRLKARRQEDRQRLLAHPIQLEPERADCADWAALLSEYIALAPDDFKFSAAQAAELVHQYTFGVKRAAVELVGGAWRRAKEARGRRALVTLDDVRSVYLSAAFADHRKDVECLWKREFGASELREDLTNPFPPSGVTESVAEATKMIVDFEQKVQDRYLDSFLTPEEQGAVKALEGHKKPGRSKGQVVRMPIAKATKQSLIETSRQMGNIWDS